MERNVQEAAENLVAHQRHNLHIAHKADRNVLELVENQVVADLLLEDLVLVPAPVVHLEKMQERKRIIKVRRLVAKKSTICKPQHWVVQLFRAVMEIRRYVFAAALLLQISLKKLVQIRRL
jgi:hypothetical protein